MLTSNELLDSVKEALKQLNPDFERYTNLVPEGFERPSYLVEAGAGDTADFTCGTLEVTQEVKVTVFVPVNEYDHSHVEALHTRTDELQRLFLSACLAAGQNGDECELYPQATHKEVGYDYGEVTVSFRWEDTRPIPGRDFPMMGEVDARVLAQ